MKLDYSLKPGRARSEPVAGGPGRFAHQYPWPRAVGLARRDHGARSKV